MPTRAMVIVAGGSGSRFGTDKLMAEIEGRPLLAHTIDAVIDRVDICVVACRPDIVETVSGWDERVRVTSGGDSRTLSEMAGLVALGDEADLIGIHDAARPVVTGALVDLLFATADQVGGAIPVLEPDHVLIDRRRHGRVSGVRQAQTPQVFRASALMTAYVMAARAGFEAHDTADVVQRFSDVPIQSVQGDPANVKVTFPTDLERVTATIRARSRT